MVVIMLFQIPKPKQCFISQTRYELLTQETRNVRVAGSPIKTLEEWRSICEAVLENGRCYPESVLDTLMSECRNLVYSPPNSRRFS